jgi:hypothetical protein
MDKCELWAPSEATREQLRATMQQEGVNIPLTQGVMAAGVPIGEPQYVEDNLKSKFDEISSTVNKLKAIWSSSKARVSNLTQATFQILSYCIAPASVNYLLRTVPPLVIAEHAARFDNEVLELLTDLAKDARQLETTQARSKITTQIAHLPMKQGGMGLTSAVEMSKAAYWSAGMEAVEPIASRLLDQDEKDQALAQPEQFNRKYFPILTELSRAGVFEQEVEVKDAIYKMLPSQLVGTKAKGLQKGLAALKHKRMEEVTISDLQKEGVNPMRVQQFVSGQGETLHAFMAPAKHHYIPNDVMSALLTHRLQMPFLFNAIEGQPEQNAICNKCANNSANMEAIGIDPSGEHITRCNTLEIGGVVNKVKFHNVIVRELAKIFKPYCQVREGEQRIEWPRKEGREAGEKFSDMAVVIAGDLRHIDVTVKALLTSADNPRIEAAPRHPPPAQMAAAAAAAHAPQGHEEIAVQLALGAIAAVMAHEVGQGTPPQQAQAAAAAAAVVAAAGAAQPEAAVAGIWPAAAAGGAAAAEAQEQRQRKLLEAIRSRRRAAEKGEEDKQKKYSREFIFPCPASFLPFSFEFSGTMGPKTLQNFKNLHAELIVGDHWRNRKEWTAEDKKLYGAAITRSLRGLMVAINVQKGRWLLEMEKRMRKPEWVRWQAGGGPPQGMDAAAVAAAEAVAAGGGPPQGMNAAAVAVVAAAEAEA